MAYPYGPAFVAFCGGAPVEEISEEFKIPLKSLKAKMLQEGWKGLATQMAGCITADHTPHAEALAKCEANRAKNYETAAKLREDVLDIVTRLRAGTLKIKKQFHNKGLVVEHEAEPSIQERLSLAIYATTVADLSYRALGDHAANGGYRADTSAGTPPPSPPITIVLPAPVARPREERSPELEHRIIDGDPTAPLLLP